jgi:hypothetical protein
VVRKPSAQVPVRRRRTRSVAPSVPARGGELLYLRYVSPGVAREAKALAAARGWTLSELLAQLLALRTGSLEICAAYPNQMSVPIATLLERLQLDRRAV